MPPIANGPVTSSARVNGLERSAGPPAVWCGRDSVRSVAGAEGRNGRLPCRLLEEADIVDALGVVGVVVGVEDRSQLRDAGIEALRPQVGRGVDQDRRLLLA